jgi:hypothetical protein
MKQPSTKDTSLDSEVCSHESVKYRTDHYNSYFDNTRTERSKLVLKFTDKNQLKKHGTNSRICMLFILCQQEEH